PACCVPPACVEAPPEVCCCGVFAGVLAPVCCEAPLPLCCGAFVLLPLPLPVEPPDLLYGFRTRALLVLTVLEGHTESETELGNVDSTPSLHPGIQRPVGSRGH